MNKYLDTLIFVAYRTATNIIALWFASVIFKHINVTSFGVLVMAGLILTALNLLVKPFFLFISLPVVVLTMGIGYLIVNAVILMIMSWAVKGYDIDGFWTAIGASIVVSITNILFDAFANSRTRRR